MSESSSSGPLGPLVDHLLTELEAKRSIDVPATAERFGLSEDEVSRCLDGLRAVHELGEAVSDDLDEAAAIPLMPAPEGYTLLGELGRGGMGIVFRARHEETGQVVALKVIRPHERTLGPALARFRQEAKALARLDHPGIVSIHEVGEVEDSLYFTMDLIEGDSLDQRLARGKIPAGEAIYIVMQAAEAMAYVHDRGLIHRDLKPQNILLNKEGRVLITDFGLVRQLDEDRTELTRTGQVLGTPHYMSPEQARGDSEEIGPAADVWALGCVLYESLCGRRPFEGDNAARVLFEIMNRTPVRPRKIVKHMPREVQMLIMRALSPNPRDRYSDASAFLRDLQAFRSDGAVRAKGDSDLRRIGGGVRRHARSIVSATVAALVVFLALFPHSPLRVVEPAIALRELEAELASRDDDDLRYKLRLRFWEEDRANVAHTTGLIREEIARCYRFALANRLEAAQEELGRAESRLRDYRRALEKLSGSEQFRRGLHDERFLEDRLNWTEMNLNFIAGREVEDPGLFEQRANAFESPETRRLRFEIDSLPLFRSGRHDLELFAALSSSDFSQDYPRIEAARPFRAAYYCAFVKRHLPLCGSGLQHLRYYQSVCNDAVVDEIAEFANDRTLELEWRRAAAVALSEAAGLALHHHPKIAEALSEKDITNSVNLWREVRHLPLTDRRRLLINRFLAKAPRERRHPSEIKIWTGRRFDSWDALDEWWTETSAQDPVSDWKARIAGFSDDAEPAEILRQWNAGRFPSSCDDELGLLMRWSRPAGADYPLRMSQADAWSPLVYRSDGSRVALRIGVFRTRGVNLPDRCREQHRMLLSLPHEGSVAGEVETWTSRDERGLMLESRISRFHLPSCFFPMPQRFPAIDEVSIRCQLAYDRGEISVQIPKLSFIERRAGSYASLGGAGQTFILDAGSASAHVLRSHENRALGATFVIMLRDSESGTADWTMQDWRDQTTQRVRALADLLENTETKAVIYRWQQEISELARCATLLRVQEAAPHFQRIFAALRSFDHRPLPFQEIACALAAQFLSEHTLEGAIATVAAEELSESAQGEEIERLFDLFGNPLAGELYAKNATRADLRNALSQDLVPARRRATSAKSASRHAKRFRNLYGGLAIVALLVLALFFSRAIRGHQVREVLPRLLLALGMWAATFTIIVANVSVLPQTLAWGFGLTGSAWLLARRTSGSLIAFLGFGGCLVLHQIASLETLGLIFAYFLTQWTALIGTLMVARAVGDPAIKQRPWLGGFPIVAAFIFATLGLALGAVFRELADIRNGLIADIIFGSVIFFTLLTWWSRRDEAPRGRLSVIQILLVVLPVTFTAYLMLLRPICGVAPSTVHLGESFWTSFGFAVFFAMAPALIRLASPAPRKRIRPASLARHHASPAEFEGAPGS